MYYQRDQRRGDTDQQPAQDRHAPAGLQETVIELSLPGQHNRPQADIGEHFEQVAIDEDDREDPVDFGREKACENDRRYQPKNDSGQKLQ